MSDGSSSPAVETKAIEYTHSKEKTMILDERKPAKVFKASQGQNRVYNIKLMDADGIMIDYYNPGVYSSNNEKEVKIKLNEELIGFYGVNFQYDELGFISFGFIVRAREN